MFNVARGRSLAFSRDVVDVTNTILGTMLRPVPGSVPAARSRPWLADVGLAETVLGFCANTDLEQGLRRCIAHDRVRHHQPDGLLT